MQRFASREGYVLHQDVLSCLAELKGRGIKLGVLSNSDPRTIKVIESLGVVPDFVPLDKYVYLKETWGLSLICHLVTVLPSPGMLDSQSQARKSSMRQ